jgi:hypothetical protein
MQPLCQSAAHDFLSSGKPTSERWENLIKNPDPVGFIRHESPLQDPTSGWADVGTEGRNSSGNRFALVHVVRHGSLKVHALHPAGHFPVPFGQASMPICSSCRACEAAFGCAAVVKSVIAVCQADRVSRTYDCCAAERSLAGSTAATASSSLLNLPARASVAFSSIAYLYFQIYRGRDLLAHAAKPSIKRHRATVC